MPYVFKLVSSGPIMCIGHVIFCTNIPIEWDLLRLRTSLIAESAISFVSCNIILEWILLYQRSQQNTLYVVYKQKLLLSKFTLIDNVIIGTGRFNYQCETHILYQWWLHLITNICSSTLLMTPPPKIVSCHMRTVSSQVAPEVVIVQTAVPVMSTKLASRRFLFWSSAVHSVNMHTVVCYD